MSVLERDLSNDALHAATHFIGGSTRKGEQQNAPWIGAFHNQMRHTVGERIGFARPGPGDDK